RYRAMRLVRSMRDSDPRRVGSRATSRQPNLPYLTHLRTERLRPVATARRRRINAAVSSIVMLFIFALLTAALLGGPPEAARSAQPILVSAPVQPDPMAASTRI